MSYPSYYSIPENFKNCGIYSDSDSDIGTSSLIGSDDDDYHDQDVDLLAIIDYNNIIESIPIFRVFLDPYNQDDVYPQLSRIYEQKLMSYCKALALTTGNNIDLYHVNYCATNMTYNVLDKILHPRSETIPFCYPVYVLTRITGCHEYIVRVMLDLVDKMIKTCHNYDMKIIDSMLLEAEMINLDILTRDERQILISNLSYQDNCNMVTVKCKDIHLKILLAVLISFHHDFGSKNPNREEIYIYVRRADNLELVKNMYKTPWIDFCLSYTTQI